MQELLDRDAHDQAKAIRNGDVSAPELLHASLDRIDTWNPTLNSVVVDLREKAVEQAKSPPPGPYQGVPMLLKDLACSIEGHPIYNANRAIKEHGWRGKSDSHLGTQLKDAGFVFAGRTNTPEFGLIATTEPVVYGPCANPWDTTLSTAGSSGGAAAALASRTVAAAHGSDAGGSIRAPASACGVVGLKPSRGRVSSGPGRSDARAGFTSEGVLTRTVRDTAAILDAISTPMPGDAYIAPKHVSSFADAAATPPKSLRIGFTSVSPDGEVAVDAECVTAVATTAHLLEELGHTVTESAPEQFFDAEFRRAYGIMYMCRAARTVAYWGEQIGKELGPDDVEPHTWAGVEYGRSIAAPDYISAVERVQANTYAMAQWWENDADIFLTPTLTTPPPKLGEIVSTKEDVFRAYALSGALNAYLPLFNASGQPAISLPMHWSDSGLPIGIQLVAAYGREDILLSVATQLEQARPWANRLPTLKGESA